MGHTRSRRGYRGETYKKETAPPAPTGPCPTPHKRKHGTRGQAKIARRQQTGGGSGLCVYRCECGCWHVGTLTASSRSAARDIARKKLGQ